MTLRTIDFIVFKNLHDFVVVKKRGMLYTAGLIVSHLQLLFVVVVVLTNHNKPRWLTCDPTWRACGENITDGNLASFAYVLKALSRVTPPPLSPGSVQRR